MASDFSPKDHPLGLTVHSLPVADQAVVAQSARTRGGRWKMLLLLLVCAAPVVASYFTYYVIRPEGRRNFGQLIDPQRPLPDSVATTLDGRQVNLRELKDQWLLISVAPAGCDALCAQHLYLQRQLREGLGKEKDRLEWLWLVVDGAPVVDALKPALKEATVLRVAPAELAQWLEPEKGHTLPEHLYLVDPLGNWMMRFPAHTDPQLASSSAPQIKRDLERLMRASVFWDKAGR